MKSVFFIFKMRFFSLIALVALASAELFDDAISIFRYFVWIVRGVVGCFMYFVMAVGIGVTIVRRLIWMRKTLAVLTSHGSVAQVQISNKEYYSKGEDAIRNTITSVISSGRLLT